MFLKVLFEKNKTLHQISVRLRSLTTVSQVRMEPAATSAAAAAALPPPGATHNTTLKYVHQGLTRLT